MQLKFSWKSHFLFVATPRRNVSSFFYSFWQPKFVPSSYQRSEFMLPIVVNYYASDSCFMYGKSSKMNKPSLCIISFLQLLLTTTVCSKQLAVFFLYGCETDQFMLHQKPFLFIWFDLMPFWRNVKVSNKMESTIKQANVSRHSLNSYADFSFKTSPWRSSFSVLNVIYL